MPAYTRNTSLRHLRPHELKPLYDMLDVRDIKYKTLADSLKKRNGSRMFSSDEVEGLQLQFIRKSSPAKEIFSRWKFDNPNICDLINTFRKCKLHREADYVLSNILKEQVPSVTEEGSDYSDSETSGSLLCPCRFDAPLRSVAASRPQENDEYETTFESENRYSSEDFYIHTSCSSEETTLQEDTAVKTDFVLRPGVVQQFEYNQVSVWTNNFNNQPVSAGGTLIGIGGFAKVYLGTVNGEQCAVKRMELSISDQDKREVQEKQFRQEFHTLASLQHKNLLLMYGFAIEDIHWCIVCEYMENGSLEDRLACKDSSPPLTIPQRLKIISDAAEGIHFLHVNHQVHRDIKSANILLSEDLVAKIGDCGLVRQGPDPDSSQSFIETQTITGTRGYIPPEYIEGIISTKMDAFAFGVVLLEVLTGLPCYDIERKKEKKGEAYLGSHVRETCETSDDFWKLRDKKCENWDREVYCTLYRLSTDLTKTNRKERKRICEVLPQLQELTDFS